MTILAIDPSTQILGAALMEDGRLVACQQFDARERADHKASDKSVRARLQRIRYLRRMVMAWLHDQGTAIDLIVVETPFTRGNDQASAAIHQAIGGILSIGILDGIEIWFKAPNEAKKAVGILPIRGAKTSAERAANRVLSKQGVIDAVNAMYSLNLSPAEDAIADAIAIGRSAQEKAAA